MSLWRLIVRSVSFYWRTNLAVLLAVVVATGVLTGALAVGDSVRYTLQKTLEARLGEVEVAVLPQGRFFRAALADDLGQQLGGTVVSVLQVSGIITNDDGSQRVNRVQVLGVTDKFYAVGSGKRPDGDSGREGVVLSEAVARRLGAGAGDEVVLRIEKPGLMPREVPLASDKDRTVASRLKVRAVADDSTFGRFDLQANQASALNVFVPLSWLGTQIEQAGRANMLLAAHLQSGLTAGEATMAVQKTWRLADAGLELERLPERNVLELRSRRIFVDESIGVEAMKAGTMRRGEGVSPLRLAGILPAERKQGQDALATKEQGQDALATKEQGQDALATTSGRATGILTYFVNEIRLGDKATPYSMVAALDSVDLGSDEIIINQWLADDLGAKVGDSVDISYFVIGPQRKLQEDRGRLKIVKIVPPDDPLCDPRLMPAFPGLADVNNCRDWKPGIPVDLGRIRPKDEQYWNEHRGTPKAFLSLEAGQQRWRNQYGSLTAVRYPWREGLPQQVERRLMSTIDPATVGLFFQPIRERGMQASRQGTDFGGLFLGLSMFLIAAAVILTGLLFVFGIESRSQQVGMLMAVGWPARRVRRLLLAEGGLIALLGTVLGVAVGLLYTRLMAYGLSTWWSSAVGGTAVYCHAKILTLLLGGLGGLLAALFAIWLTLDRQIPERDMTIARALFSFEGRLTRRDYWLKGGLVIVPLGVVSSALTFIVDNDGLRTLLMVTDAVASWPALALTVKRLHDHNRSGWFLATVLAPIANVFFSIWISAQVWFFRGTVGANRFGRDPLSGTPTNENRQEEGSLGGLLADRPDSGGPGPTPRISRSRGRLGISVAIITFISVAVFLLIMPAGGGESVVGAFFGAGALLLIGTFGLSQAVLRIAAGGWNRAMVSLQGLGLRNATRRSGRSLAVIGLLACGVFLVVAVGANRRDPAHEAQGRDSGTGGFALYADTSIPILRDLSTESGRKQLGLAGQRLDNIQAVQFRVRDGDDASCLNLNRAQQPRLMGVQPDVLMRLKAFKFTAVDKQAASLDAGWGLLEGRSRDEAIPAIGDYPTVFWALHKNIGDELEYTDEMGRPFRVRIVGLLASSVLQGSLIIAENEFVARFPSVDGYRVFLIDAPAGQADAVTQKLSSGLRDYGLVLTPTQERLAAFSAVENTYLSIFMVLGGLGLVLGSVGLGLVVLRNMLERRGELAMLRAVGFGRGQLKRMVFYEHWGLMLAGLACGVISALVAVIPALRSPGGQVPYGSLAVTVAGIALSGAVWVWIAGTLALRGGLLDALRHE